MKATGNAEKWGAAVLGVASLLLLGHLVLQISRGRGAGEPPAPRTPPRSKATPLPAAHTAAGKLNAPDDLASYDPMVKLDLLKESEDRPLPELSRNPFEFVQSAPPRPSGSVAGPAPAAPAPPPPPPVNLTVMGYSEGKGGVREAMVSDENQQVFVVHVGDSVGTRYKIVKIAPNAVSVEDSASHQTVDLPVPP